MPAFAELVGNDKPAFAEATAGKGEMSEWFKEHAWKVCIRQKRIRGSNPRLSA